MKIGVIGPEITVNVVRRVAERELPEAERYDGYPQLENGVGMLRLLDKEVDEALKALKVSPPDTEEANAPETISVATGLLAYPYLKKQIENHKQIEILKGIM